MRNEVKGKCLYFVYSFEEDECIRIKNNAFEWKKRSVQKNVFLPLWSRQEKMFSGELPRKDKISLRQLRENSRVDNLLFLIFGA